MLLINLILFFLVLMVMDWLNRVRFVPDKIKFIFRGVLYPFYIVFVILLLFIFLPIRMMTILSKGIRGSENLELVDSILEEYIFNIIRGNYYTLEPLDRDLRKIRPYLYYTIIEFFYGILIGIIIGSVIPKDTYYDIMSFILSLMLKVNLIDNKQMFSFILKNNIRASTLLFLTTCCISVLYSGFIFIYNGLIVGLVIGFNGVSLHTIMGLLPHGLFEVPAVFIVSVSGLLIDIKSRIIYKEKLDRTKVRRGIKLFIISIVLILIAAFIESNITPKIVKMF